MKALFLTNQLDVGGIETNIVRLTRLLTARGHEVVAATAGGQLVRAFEEGGGRHHHLAPGARGRAGAVRALRRALHAEAPDVVHVFSATSAVTLLAAAVGMPRRPPVVSSIMGLKTDPAESHVKTLLRAYATTLGADIVVVMSPAIGDVVRQLPVRAGRTVRMSVVGVDTPVAPPGARESVRAELGLSANTRVVSTIGRLDPTKSHELFVAAAAAVVEGRPDVTFLIVGGGALEEQLRSLTLDTGHADRIRLLGERRDVTRLLAASDIYVRPGVVEGFIGITVLEAQVLGVPTIAFETEDVKLAIQDGRTGLLVPPYDTTALAHAVGTLLDAPEQAARIGAAGQAEATLRYGLEGVVDRLERLYADVVGRHGRAR